MAFQPNQHYAHVRIFDPLTQNTLLKDGAATTNAAGTVLTAGTFTVGDLPTVGNTIYILESGSTTEKMTCTHSGVQSDFAWHQ
jgi:hypothetical protein